LHAAKTERSLRRQSEFARNFRLQKKRAASKGISIRCRCLMLLTFALLKTTSKHSLEQSRSETFHTCDSVTLFEFHFCEAEKIKQKKDNAKTRSIMKFFIHRQQAASNGFCCVIKVSELCQ